MLSPKRDFLYVEQLNGWYNENPLKDDTVTPFRQGPEALIEYIVSVYRERCGTFIFHDVRDEPKVFEQNLKALRSNFVFGLLAPSPKEPPGEVLKRLAGKLSEGLSHPDHVQLIDAFLLSRWLPSRIHDQFASRYRQGLLEGGTPLLPSIDDSPVSSDETPPPREVTSGEIPALCSSPCVNRILSFDPVKGTFTLHWAQDVLRNAGAHAEVFVKRVRERFN